MRSNSRHSIDMELHDVDVHVWNPAFNQNFSRWMVWMYDNSQFEAIQLGNLPCVFSGNWKWTSSVLTSSQKRAKFVWRSGQSGRKNGGSDILGFWLASSLLAHKKKWVWIPTLLSSRLQICLWNLPQICLWNWTSCLRYWTTRLTLLHPLHIHIVYLVYPSLPFITTIFEYFLCLFPGPL